MTNPYQAHRDADHNDAELPPDAQSGRTFVLILIVANTLLALSVIGLAAATGHHDRLPRAAVRLLVNGALMYGLWMGTRWVKWLFVLGLALSAVFCVVVMVRIEQATMFLMVPVAALLAWAAWNLAFGVSVNEFLQFQRSNS